MPRSPLALREIVRYLELEDVDGLVPGSVRYVGAAAEGGVQRHYWSYPGNDTLEWVCLDGDKLGQVEDVPGSIRSHAAPFSEHAKRPPPARSDWKGHDLAEDARPLWVPGSQVRQIDACYVAGFRYDFDHAAQLFGARPSTDKSGGGAGPCRHFFLELSRNRLAMLESCKAYSHLMLHLPERNGSVYWEDYFQVLDPLGLPLEQVFRQGGIQWKHRKPTPESIARTQDHQRRMWIPSGR